MRDDDRESRQSAPRDFGAGRGLGRPDDERDPYDVPEWVSEFRRLYVEPKTRAALRDEAQRGARRGAGSTPPGSTAAAASALPDGTLVPEEPRERPLSDEPPLRSRSELHHRDRRPAGTAGAGRRSHTSDPKHEPEAAGPPGPGSRAEARRARAERARAERRLRLRRTIVVGVLLLAVAAVVTWLVARSHEPVSAAPAEPAALVLPSSAPSVTGGVGGSAGDAASVTRPPVVGGATGVVERSLPLPSPTGVAGTATVGTPTPSPTPTPTPPARGTGRLSWVDWGDVPGLRSSGGRVVRVALELENGLGLDRSETASTISSILTDGRGWQTERDVRFVFVSAEQARSGEFDTRIAVASRLTTMDLCGPVQTEGYTSCYNGRVVLNLDRWMLAVPSYAGHLDDYRAYVVNHEVGHSFGLGHEGCPAEGEPAPVMVPQTLHLWGCAPNPYPVLD